MSGIRLRHARPSEACYLSDLMLRSKAHWGYDAAFMAACVAPLTVTEQKIAQSAPMVAVDAQDRPLGIAAVHVKGTQAKLDKLFIAPEAMGQGVGRMLFEAMVAEARRLGARKMHILSDPGAAPFYERMGAVQTGTAPSGTISGRFLPVLDVTL